MVYFLRHLLLDTCHLRLQMRYLFLEARIFGFHGQNRLLKDFFAILDVLGFGPLGFELSLQSYVRFVDFQCFVDFGFESLYLVLQLPVFGHELVVITVEVMLRLLKLHLQALSILFVFVRILKLGFPCALEVISIKPRRNKLSGQKSFKYLRW